ncbi:hypothetical protein SDC9_93878 [bioreactor metagenome]|uniref:NAD-specific glutamate dehydrogenase n=1 Tax=bioreactor metagenome TaxID=1076179 RepID=A0A645A1U6_9ZZZZ
MAAHARAVVVIAAGEVCHGADVLVATARQAHENGLVLAHLLGQLHRIGESVAGFERGDDAFGAAQVVEGLQRFAVGDAHVLRAADLLQPGMLGADAGVVQARADGVRLGDLAILILQDESAVAVQHARGAALQRRGVLAAIQAFTSGFHADQARLFERDVGVEDAHGIAATAHAGDDGVGLLGGDMLVLEHLGHLREAFRADHALEVAHHHRIRVRASDGADDVEGVVHIGHPVAHGLVERVLERLAARFDGYHRGAQQLHAVDVGALALDVLSAHVDHAFQAVARTDGGRGHAVLARAGLGDHARFAHALGEHGLADHIVDLVRAGVVEVFPLQIDLRAAHFLAGACGVIDGRGAAHEMCELVVEFLLEFGVVLVLRIGLAQLVDGVGQRFAGEGTAVRAEVAQCVRVLV